MDVTERYQILDEIGRGGMGVVYRARDMQLGREVALKLLPVALTQDGVVLRRFQQEAQLVAQLEHPHIVPIHDVGVRQEQPFIVMRLLRGGSLYDKLHQSQISPAQLWQLLHQVALALDTTHAQHIVHRDIKPTNILFDEQGQAYLTDFGIAKALDATTHYTGNAVVGSPAYMSPEQFTGQQQVDGRSDQYSLAVVAFEALAGQLPFQGNTVNMMYGHLHESPPAIHTLNPRLPAIVNEVLQKALAKTAADRFPSVLAFVETLQKAAENAPTPIHPVALTPVIPAPSKTEAAPLTTTTAEKRQLFYRQGLAALEEKRWSDAADSFRRVLELDPQHTNAKVRYEEAQRQLQGSASAAPPLPRSSTPVSPAITKGAGGVVSTQSAIQPRWKWVAGAIGLLLLLVVVGWAISRSQDEEVASAVLATQEIPTATNAVVLPTLSPTTAPPTPIAVANVSGAGDSAPVDLEFVANIYTSRAEYNLQSFEELELLEGDLVVQAEGTAVIIQNRFGAQVELTQKAVAGVRYDSSNQQFAVHCLSGLCVVRGDVAGEVTLRAGQAVVVGGNGSPGNVFPAQNELFVDIARGVVPTPTATPRATATPTPTHTSTPRPTFTATPIPTATSAPVPAPQPVQPQPQPTAVPPTPEPPTAEPPYYPTYPYPYP